MNPVRLYEKAPNVWVIEKPLAVTLAAVIGSYVVLGAYFWIAHVMLMQIEGGSLLEKIPAVLAQLKGTILIPLALIPTAGMMTTRLFRHRRFIFDNHTRLITIGRKQMLSFQEITAVVADFEKTGALGTEVFILALVTSDGNELPVFRSMNRFLVQAAAEKVSGLTGAPLRQFQIEAEPGMTAQEEPADPLTTQNLQRFLLLGLVVALMVLAVIMAKGIAAVKPTPGSPGSAALARGDNAQAIRECDAAIAQQPDRGEYYWNRGVAHWRMGQYRNAYGDLLDLQQCFGLRMQTGFDQRNKTADELGPNYRGDELPSDDVLMQEMAARGMLPAEIYVKMTEYYQNQPLRQRAYFVKALDAGPNNPMVMERFLEFCVNHHGYQTGLALADKLLQQEKSRRDVLEMKGRCLYGMARYAEARQVYQALLDDQRPLDSAARKRLEKMLRKIGQQTAQEAP